MIVEHGPTDAMFDSPLDPRTLDYVTAASADRAHVSSSHHLDPGQRPRDRRGPRLRPLRDPVGAGAAGGRAAAGVRRGAGAGHPARRERPDAPSAPTKVEPRLGGHHGRAVRASRRPPYAPMPTRSCREPKGCKVGWTTLAGIGWVESQHGTIGGRTLGDDGHSSTPVLGPALDGKKFAAMRAKPRARRGTVTRTGTAPSAGSSSSRPPGRPGARDGDADGVRPQRPRRRGLHRGALGFRRRPRPHHRCRLGGRGLRLQPRAVLRRRGVRRRPRPTRTAPAEDRPPLRRVAHRRPALSFDLRGAHLPSMSVLATSGEEPPQIGCNEDAATPDHDRVARTQRRQARIAGLASLVVRGVRVSP